MAQCDVNSVGQKVKMSSSPAKIHINEEEWLQLLGHLTPGSMTSLQETLKRLQTTATNGAIMAGGEPGVLLSCAEEAATLKATLPVVSLSKGIILDSSSPSPSIVGQPSAASSPAALFHLHASAASAASATSSVLNTSNFSLPLFTCLASNPADGLAKAPGPLQSPSYQLSPLLGISNTTGPCIYSAVPSLSAPAGLTAMSPLGVGKQPAAILLALAPPANSGMPAGIAAQPGNANAALGSLNVSLASFKPPPPPHTPGLLINEACLLPTAGLGSALSLGRHFTRAGAAGGPVSEPLQPAEDFFPDSLTVLPGGISGPGLSVAEFNSLAAAAVISNIAGASSASLPASLSLASYPCPEAIDLHGSSGASRASCGSFDSACRDSIDGLASLDPNTLVTLSNLAAAAAAAESNGFCSLNTLATAALAVANAQNHQVSQPFEFTPCLILAPTLLSFLLKTKMTRSLVWSQSPFAV